MKKILFLALCLFGCTFRPPNTFIYREIKTDNFTIATWQKITNPMGDVRIYIEGDGYSFNTKGYPTTNPTPKSKLIRKIAFNDPNENVIYIARPCQFVKDSMCKEKYWTTARFSNEVINSIEQTITNSIGKQKKLILIGYSGGAQIAGLLSQRIEVKKIITIAGVLDNKAWTNYHKVKPLTESLNFIYNNNYSNFQQIHFVGEKDMIVPSKLTKQIIKSSNIIVVPNATHNNGWETIYEIIHK